jgi:hypothetical protein
MREWQMWVMEVKPDFLEKLPSIQVRTLKVCHYKDLF